MSRMVCGKCESESTYYQDGGLACMKCGNRSPSRWGFRRKDEEIKAPEPIEAYAGPGPEDDETEQTEEIDMGKKRTPEQRERIAAGIRAAMARKKAAAGGGQSNVEKKQRPAIIVHDSEAHASAARETVRGKLRTGLRKAAAPTVVINKLPGPPSLSEIKEDVALLMAPLISQDPRIVLLDFTLQENAHLYEPWVKYGRSNRRGPGDQAMMIVEELLTREGLL